MRGSRCRGWMSCILQSSPLRFLLAAALSVFAQSSTCVQVAAQQFSNSGPAEFSTGPLLAADESCVDNTADAYVQVARCTKIINPGTDEAKYVINVKQIAKVGLSTPVSWCVTSCAGH